MAAKKTKTTAEQLLAYAIGATGVAEVVRVSSDSQSVKVLYRVRDKQAWLSILEYTLARASDWSAHVCQQYFLRGGKLVYGWNFILQSPKGPETAVEHVSALLREAVRAAPKVTRGQLESFPLVGVSRNRSAEIRFDPRLPGPEQGGPSHKGAYGVKSGEK